MTARSLLASAAVLVGAGALWAHAVVVPGTTSVGAYETYTLRVPNEKDIATTRVEITFPAEIFVISFAEVTGWDLEVERDETGRAVSAAWTGELPPNRFVELPFVGVNPREPATLVWAVDQTYRGASGEEVVSWSGPEDSEFPASRTSVVASAEEAVTAGAAHDDQQDADDVLPLVALLTSVVALGVAAKAAFS